MKAMHDVFLILAAVLVTMATRFIPFLIFGKKGKTPPIIEYLGTVLPCVIMGMLVVYCLKDISLLSKPFGLPEIISCVVVAALHVWKRNSLFSIGGGTVCYMLLVQLVF